MTEIPDQIQLPPSGPPPPGLQPWLRAVMWVAIVLIVVGGGVFVLWSCHRIPGEVLEQTGKVITKAEQALRDVASAFARGTVTSSFISYATTIDPTHYLQFATLNQMEIFSRSDERTFGYIPLPEVVVEARAPIEYTYYVDFNGAWNFLLEDGVVNVFAPPIRFNKPAVDASKISYEVRKGMFGSAKVQEDLKKSISLLATQKAQQNINLVREVGRKQIGDFVERWLIETYADGRRYPVKVYFPDEAKPGVVVLTNAPPR